jgi:hypothetical protein
MTARDVNDCESCEEPGMRLKKLNTAFLERTVTWEEYAYNVFLTLVTMCENCIERSIALLEPRIAEDLVRYSDQFLVRVDFMPCARPLLPAHATEDDVLEKQRRLRPRYVRIRNAIVERMRQHRKQ